MIFSDPASHPWCCIAAAARGRKRSRRGRTGRMGRRATRSRERRGCGGKGAGRRSPPRSPTPVSGGAARQARRSRLSAGI